MNLRSPLDYLSVFKVTTRERWDWGTPLVLACLGALGLFFIYSSQFSGQAPMPSQGGLLAWLNWARGILWIKQAIFLALGAGVYLAVSMMDYRFWLSVSHWFYAASIVLLLLVLSPVGFEAGGSQRWISLGFFSLQPSEIAKVSVLIITASILIRAKVGSVAQSLGTLGKLALAVGVPMFLIWRQPDLKPVIVLPPMVFSMLYVSKLTTRFFIAVLGIFLVIAAVVWFDIGNYVDFMKAHGYKYSDGAGKYEKVSWLPLRDYQRNRLVPFVRPDKTDQGDIVWNQQQSIIAIGSGGPTGKGWTLGSQAQLGYLPRTVAHTDFIFPVIAEEKGFLGSLTVLGLYGLVLFNGIRIAGLARDRLGTLLAIGVTVLFAVHVFVNIAMAVGLVPITGIPLPFISYGGSFVLGCCLLQGLVQSVYRFRKDFT